MNSLNFTVKPMFCVGVFPRLFPVQKTGIKKPAVTGWFFEDFWSAREDLNLRPTTPHEGYDGSSKAILN
ncbi:hypothetical protein CQA28_18900 [Citrobacter freundii]|nr:hypothetical protein CQA28_18900 [Citrobacter freundii]